MSRLLKTSVLTRSLLAASIALTSLVAVSDNAAAQSKTQQIDIDLGPISIGIGRPGRPWPGPFPGPRPTPKPQPKYEYVVQEINPFTGGVYGSVRRFNSQSEAYAYRDTIARAHWVKWRFMGINEPLRFQRFGSSTAAQNFVQNDGPSKTGKLGFALLEKGTQVVATRVTMSTRKVN